MNNLPVFIFHFAGGNCYSFDFLKPFLKGFNIITPELPGRGRRLREDLIKDTALAAMDLYAQVRRKIGSGPYILYGHSMGSCLGLRVARMLEKEGLPPSWLIVSGNPGPGIRDDKRRYKMNHDEFVQELKLLGGVPPEILDNEEAFGYFEPILRADFEVAENESPGNEEPVNIPITAMMGDKEEKVGQISNWSRFTTAGFRHKIMEGDHFFIFKHPQAVAAVIKDCIEKISLQYAQ